MPMALNLHRKGTRARDPREEVRRMHRNKCFTLSVFILVLALALPMALAADPHGGHNGRQQARADIPRNAVDQYDRAQKAADVLVDLNRAPETGIPKYLMDRAYGIAVFPHVVKGAFIVGGSWGKGLLSVRRNGRWEAPIYVELTGGSFGFQIGGEATDLVLVFTDRRGVDSLLSSKVKLGADASVAAGPVGRSAQAGTDVKLNAAVYSYSRSKGLFGGIALDGAVLSLDNSANRKVYGMDGKQVLARALRPSSVTMPFLAALRQYSPRVTK
jgi:lipid-binding SYLF domain-containing protein